MNFDNNNFAVKFVNIYISEGPGEAGIFALDSNIDFFSDDPEIEKIKNAVREEFINRGYEIIEKEDN